MFIEKKEFLRYLKLTELFLEIETFFFVQVLWENTLFNKYFSTQRLPNFQPF